MGMTSGISRLDRLESRLLYDPLTTAAMRRAAEFWAFIRRSECPPRIRQRLDADCILAAQASLIGGSRDVVTIATRNVAHLTRFPGVDARPWELIVS